MPHLSPRTASISVDFGTSHTVVTMRRADGRVHQQLFDGSPQLPSAVFLGDDGLIVGADAAHEGRRRPERLEPNPKRRIDDGTVLLGETELPVTGVIAAVLSRVARECGRTLGGLGPVTLTVPASWGPSRRHAVADAAAAARLGGVSLVVEPVAAASYFAEALGNDVPVGSGVVVYDLGGGTFDATVLRRTPAGFEVLAVEGADNLGGLDFDQALVEYLSRSFRSEDPRWSRLMEPQDGADRRHRLALLDEVRGAKERLSRIAATGLTLPLLDADVHLTREELESVAAPLIERTVRITQGVIREAGLALGQISGLFLVGAASRMPLVATMLHRGLGIAPAAIEQPELAVSEGGLVARSVISSPAALAPAGGAAADTPDTPPQGAPPPGPTPTGGRPPEPAGPAPDPRTRSDRRDMIAFLAVVLVATLASILVVFNLGDGGTGQQGSIAGLETTSDADEEPGTRAEADDEEGDLLERAQNGATVRVAYAETYPYNYTDEDGDLVGQSTAMLEYLFAQLGIAEEQIEWIATDWPDLLPGLGETHDVIAAAMYIYPERCAQAAFAEPDYVMPDSLLVLDGNPLGLSDLDSIATHEAAVVGVVNGTVEQEMAMSLGIPVDRIASQTNLDALLLELKAGRIDAIAYPGVHLRLQAAADDAVEVVGEFWRTDPETGEEVVDAGATAFRPADSAFRDAFNEELAKLLNDPDQWEALVGKFGFTVEANLPPEDLTAEDLCEGEYQ